MTVKKPGGDDGRTRNAILDATEAIMREEGYAAATSRRVAAKAGLKSQLAYYHFGTMDDLFLALYRREDEKYFAAYAKALTARNPLRALWELNSDSTGTELAMEFIALANHRKEISKEIVRSTQRYRSLQTAMCARVLQEHKNKLGLSAGVLAFLMLSTSRALVTEAAIGVTDAHQEVRAYVEENLKLLD